MMISAPLLLATVLAQASPATPGISPEKSCSICHTDRSAARRDPASVHGDLDCTDCHDAFGFNPHRAVAEAIEDEPADGVSGARPVDALCGNCHEDERAGWRESVHGRTGPAPAERPDCGTCHGEPHRIEPAGKRVMAARCIACHGFSRPGEPERRHVVDTYRDTVHGKMLQLGNESAAACADCHRAHAIFGPDDPRSSVYPDHRQETCGRCHEKPPASFLAAVSHAPPTIDEDYWRGVTVLGFSLLTVSVILLLLLHMTADLWRMALRRPEPPPAAAPAPTTADTPVRRFSIHARLQHIGMMLSFTRLVLTGWPLKAAEVGESSRLAELLGGQAMLGIVHRVAGVFLLAVSVYHLSWLAVLLRRKQLDLAMIPAISDFVHLWHNLLYYFGRRSEKPRFGRWTYYEKFDYWAVFWGMVIMGGSGLLLWFPVAASHLLPGKLIAIAHIAHSDEALLAALAIFVWHFYNVHLRPTVFPMSWVWISGNISAESLYEEHRALYEQRFGTAPPSPAPHSWHRKRRWSYLALLAVLALAALALYGNVASVRDRAWVALDGGHAEPAPVAAVVPAVMRAAAVDPFKHCFVCHNRQRWEAPASGFSHKEHIDDERIEPDCKGCHSARMHVAAPVNTGGCLDCHEADGIGLSPPEPSAP